MTEEAPISFSSE